MDLAHGIQPSLDEKELDQGSHAHRFDFGTFAGGDLADDGNPDGILSVCAACQFENRAEGARADATHGLAARAFLFHISRRNNSLYDNSGGRWPFVIN